MISEVEHIGHVHRRRRRRLRHDGRRCRCRCPRCRNGINLLVKFTQTRHRFGCKLVLVSDVKHTILLCMRCVLLVFCVVVLGRHVNTHKQNGGGAQQHDLDIDALLSVVKPDWVYFHANGQSEKKPTRTNRFFVCCPGHKDIPAPERLLAGRRLRRIFRVTDCEWTALCAA